MNIPTLKIGDHTARIPIIQGGMGVGVSLHRLASAVANEGGIGIIATAGIGMLETDGVRHYLKASARALKREIHLTRKLAPQGIIGINIMVSTNDYKIMVNVSLKENVNIIFTGAGLPLTLPKFKSYYPNSKTALVPIVSSGRAANLISKRWIKHYNYVPDAFVVEGPLAGGHLGFKMEDLIGNKFNLEELVKEVLEITKPLEEKYKKKIPVIAAGGIYTGYDIAKFLRMGASGVQMATRFVTTHECDASIEFKKNYIKAKKEDVILIESPLGMPGRAINNEFLESVKRGEKKPFKCVFHYLKDARIEKAPYCIALALTNAQKGNLKDGFTFAGYNAWRINRILSVKELMQELTDELKKA